MKGIYIQFNAIIPLAIRNILKNWVFLIHRRNLRIVANEMLNVVKETLPK